MDKVNYNHERKSVKSLDELLALNSGEMVLVNFKDDDANPIIVVYNSLDDESKYVEFLEPAKDSKKDEEFAVQGWKFPTEKLKFDKSGVIPLEKDNGDPCKYISGSEGYS